MACNVPMVPPSHPHGARLDLVLRENLLFGNYAVVRDAGQRMCESGWGGCEGFRDG